ncbi:MAG: nicotinamide-nucleotide amidohydrolase family protein [Steroidobacteraceae bacterium]
MPDDETLAAYARAAGDVLRARGLHAVTVESCTGGYVAKLLTDIPGSSRWFEAGLVTYSNVAKQRDVGVRASTLAAHGAVSEACVREMASGALLKADADRAVAITGVAGPDGGTPRNPVGSVWFARADREGDLPIVRSQHQQFSGDRDAVRRQAAAFALKLLAVE